MVEVPGSSDLNTTVETVAFVITTHYAIAQTIDAARLASKIMLRQISNDDLSGYRDAWTKAKPFPHLVIDDFVQTSSMLVRDFPNISWPNWVPLGDSYQKNTYICSDLGVFPNDIKNLIEELASPKFLKLIEQVTSIDGLIPDPYLAGGGYISRWQEAHLRHTLISISIRNWGFTDD